MNNTQKAIVPGIFAGISMLIFLSRLVNPSSSVMAAAEEVQQPETSSQSQQCALYNQYPEKIQPWCPLIESAASQYSVDPLLIAAVMLMESGGQPQIMSSAGAVGLMQVMPSDGIAASFQCINGPCFAARPTIEELKDPAFNVDYGVRMLAGLISRHGDIREALKSYGPSNYGYTYADKVLAIRGRF